MSATSPEPLPRPDIIHLPPAAAETVRQLLTDTGSDRAADRLAAANAAAHAAYEAGRTRDRTIRHAYSAGAGTDDLAAATGLDAAQIRRIILTD